MTSALFSRTAASLALGLAASAGVASDKAVNIVPDPLATLMLQRLGAQDQPTCLAVATISEAPRTAFACTKDAGPVRFDADSIFEIGSVTKVFTGLLLADMVRRGEVALSDPASKHAPPGAKLPKRGEREITLGDLVSHASGLPRLPPDFQPADPANPYARFDTAALYEALERTELASDPGTRVVYSNLGFLWLSDLLGRAAGKPYDRLLEERVLAPLGMKSTAVLLDDEQRKRFVQGHSPMYKPVPPWDFDPAIAGVGGLRSSLADMVRFAEAAAGRRETPLAQSFALSLTPLQPGPGGASMAYAWSGRERGVGRVFFHNGETGGFHAAIAVNPGARTAAVVLANSATNIDDLALNLVDPSQALRKKRVAIALAPARLDEYAGSYALAPDFVIRVYREGARMMTQATGQQPIEIFAEAEDRFFVRVIDAQLTFRRGADGRIDALTLHQGGRDSPGKRLP